MGFDASQARALELDLRRLIGGEIRFDAASRVLYSTDASNYQQFPIGVVIPRTLDDVFATVELCRKHGAPLLSRGAGTSIAGQSCNVAVILDFSKYLNKVLEVDPRTERARVQPGAILDDLRGCAEQHHLTFGPDPATHDRCTLGGMIGNNSCGVHSVMAGRTSDNIEELTVLTYDGERMTVGRTDEAEVKRIIAGGGRRGAIYGGMRAIRDRTADLIRARYPKIPRRVSGFNLDELLPENGFHVARALVATEGTCAVVLEAKVKLVHSPPYRRLLVLGYPDVYAASDDVLEVLATGPIGLEGMDDYLRNFLRAKRGLSPEEQQVLPEGTGWLLVEYGGETPEDAEAKARRTMEMLETRRAAKPSMKLTDAREAQVVWDVRKSGLGATSMLPDGRRTWPGWEDAAVPPERLGSYLRDFAKLRDSFGYESAMYGHWGQACVHMRIDFDLFTAEGVRKFVEFMNAAGDLCVSYGGSLSGEHGDGQARGFLLPKMYGEELTAAFREFKALWDPEWKMNPGKKIDPAPPDAHLRLGPDWKPWKPATHFSFFESQRSMPKALLRCVGVGKCRRLEGGTMCPSFMVTREEMHSTRGRARLLSDMLDGKVIKSGWKSEEVKEALDLCLACKGCRSDCPVNVDMATYKSEFLSHYYEGRLRPMHAYAMGLIYWWARVASIAPGLVNGVTHAPGISSAFKSIGGMAAQREVPRFARRTFKKWFFGPGGPGGAPNITGSERTRGDVLLWADCFNNYFLPNTAVAAVHVLQNVGFRVRVPRQSLCCGRPLYDQGMLGLAKRQLRQIMTVLREEIQSGMPILVLEPSCAATFRDELPNLFPDDEIAHKLASQVYLFAEFLEKRAPEWPPPRVGAHVLFHGHCHQKAVMGTVPDLALLKRAGCTVDAPETGCCGMAGSFGFVKKNYDVSVAVGERVLLPAVRDLAEDAFVVTDGFSCREQIEQLTGRTALHLAELLAK